jgi:CRISPR/Cas system-associated endonuclease/helicase Cas3
MAGIATGTGVARTIKGQNPIDVTQVDRVHSRKLQGGVMPSIVIFDEVDMLDIISFLVGHIWLSD